MVMVAVLPAAFTFTLCGSRLDAVHDTGSGNRHCRAVAPPHVGITRGALHGEVRELGPSGW